MHDEFTARMYGIVVGTTVTAIVYANCVVALLRGGYPIFALFMGLLSAELIWSWGSLVYHWKWGRIAQGANVQCTALFGCLRLIVVPPSESAPGGRLEIRTFRRVDVIGDVEVVARAKPDPVSSRMATRSQTRGRKQTRR